MKRIWITRWCLSEGIIEGTIEGNDIRWTDKSGGSRRYGVGYFCRPSRDFCETRHEAEIVAREMRLKKIASLKKQIAKLEAMTFSVSDAGKGGER